MRKILYIVIIILIGVLPLWSRTRIGVLKSRYDEVDTVLHNYKLQFDTINYRDLENIEVLNKYDALFFPCGIEPSIEENLEVRSYNTSIQSVKLKKTYRNIDMEKITENIRNFVESGGSAYFSGYSFKLLNETYPVFSFFDKFPYMGMPGRIEANLKNDIARFCMKERMALYMTHSGWISLKSAGDSEVIVDATYDTPRGKRMGPITVLLEKGDGEILFTSYHSTIFSDFRRFNIYRIAGIRLLDKIYELTTRWEQTITAVMADSVQRGENYRMYYMELKKGMNTIYFISQKAPYQVDIFDRGMSIIQSNDTYTNKMIFDIESKYDEECIVKVYPGNNVRFGMYALVSAEGSRKIPYIEKIAIIAGIVFSIILLFIIKRTFFYTRYSGRF